MNKSSKKLINQTINNLEKLVRETENFSCSATDALSLLQEDLSICNEEVMFIEEKLDTLDRDLIVYMEDLKKSIALLREIKKEVI